MINRKHPNNSSNNPPVPGFGPNGNAIPSLPGSSGNITITPINPIVFPTAYIRFFHAAPLSPVIDVYANGSLYARNLRYGDFTEYAAILPGVYTITVYPAGQMSKALFVSRINVQRNSITTLAIIGKPDTLSILPITDQSQNASPSLTYLRFVHVSPNISTIDIYIDNILVIKDMDYKEISNYLSLTPGQHSITIRAAHTDAVIANADHINLQSGNFYTCYLVGYLGETPGVELLIPLEGTSYLTF